MRNAFVLRAADGGILQAVELDDAGAVAENGERPLIRLEPALRLRGAVLRDGEKDGSFRLDLPERSLQLSELPLAMRSPVAAAEELENDGISAAEVRELVEAPVRIGQLEVGSLVSNGHRRPLKGESRRREDHCPEQSANPSRDGSAHRARAGIYHEMSGVERTSFSRESSRARIPES
jgi:hypothetical protein